MADIKVIYKNTDGLDNEHNETADSVKMLSFKTANYELTDIRLGHLIGGGDGSAQHTHDSVYFRENEFINVSTGAPDAGKPVKTDSGGKIDNSLINVSSLNALLDHGALTGLGDDDHSQYSRADGTRDFTGVVKYSSLVSITLDPQIVHKKYVDDSIASALVGNEWYESAVDRTLSPPGSPVTGDRYLIDGALGTATGAFTGQEDKIAEYNGSAWVFTTPSVGGFISIDDEPDYLYYYGGSNWTTKAFENTTASTGLVKVGADIRLDASAAGAGLGFLAGVLSANVDGASLEISSDTIRVKTDGINDTHIDFGTGTNQVSAVDIPVADAGSYFATDNVEAALQQLAVSILQNGVDYTAGAGGIAKGDLVYVSTNNTVLPLTTLTSNARCIGVALTASVAGAPVKILADDTVLAGALSGATAGTPYYWSGSGFQTSIPSAGNSNIWLVGVAKNATDLHVEILHIKKNAA